MLDNDISFDVPINLRIETFHTMFNYQASYYVGESHNFWECVYVKDGNLCNVIDGKVYNMKTGDFIFYKPMEFHRHYIEDDKEAETFFFSFSFEKCPEDFAADTVYRLTTKQRNIMEKIIDFANDALKTPSFTEKEISDLKEKYIQYDYIKLLLALSKNATALATVANYIEELFLDLYNSKHIVKESTSIRAGIYKQAISFMNDNLSKKFTIPDIAKHCCVSETTLKKVFYEYSNMAIHKHLLKMKINQAIIFLTSGASASKTSKQLGFASQAYFTAAFKRETGLTPREYISKYRN